MSRQLRAALCVLSLAGAGSCAETIEQHSQSLREPSPTSTRATAHRTTNGFLLGDAAARPPMQLPPRDDDDAPSDAMEPPPDQPRADAGARAEPHDAAAIDVTEPLDAAQDAALEDARVDPGALCVAGELECAADQRCAATVGAIRTERRRVRRGHHDLRAWPMRTSRAPRCSAWRRPRGFRDAQPEPLWATPIAPAVPLGAVVRHRRRSRQRARAVAIYGDVATATGTTRRARGARARSERSAQGLR